MCGIPIGAFHGGREMEVLDEETEEEYHFVSVTMFYFKDSIDNTLNI